MNAPTPTLPLLFLSVTVMLSLPLVAGFFGAEHPAFDAFSHFRVHLAILMMLSALPLFFFSMRLHGLLTLAFGAASLATVFGSAMIPGLSSVHALPSSGPERSVYRLLQLNLRFDNRQPDKVLELVRTTRPDLLAFEEVSRRWTEPLASLAGAYPFRTRCPGEDDNHGIVILSARPLSSVRCLDERKAIAAQVDLDGRPVDIAAIHLSWPWPSDQREHAEYIAPRLGQIGPDAIVAGDFNAAPWSETARLMAEGGRLKPAVVPGATWLPRSLPDWLRFAGLPIDQVLSKGDVLVHAVRLMPPAGSDHLPLLVEFSLRPETQAPAEKQKTALLPGPGLRG